jgi:ABC-type dipeptide/oligopeptide/nickel transport system permease subunit/ABC-type transport system substrate-binding protein
MTGPAERAPEAGGPLRLGLARFRRDRPAMLGLAIVAALALFALLGPMVARWDPDASDFSLARDRFGAPPGPSAAHWLGTDPLFRDLLARLAAGARVSLSVALLATVVSTAIGAAVGLLAGMTAGTAARAADAILMRAVDVLLALPFLLVVTAVGVAVGRADVGTLLLLLGLTGWTGAARLVRAKTMAVRELDFVAAARALGAGPWRIVVHHVLPSLTGTLLALGSTLAAQMILAEAVLGYLTVGVQPPRASWGRMLHEGEGYLGTRLALVAIPGFAILLAALGFARVGDGLRDALDPRGPALGPRRRLPVDLLIAGAAMLLLSAAVPNGVAPPIGASDEAAGDPPRRGGVLHVATLVNLRSVDPALAYDEAWRSVSELIFARLVTFDDEGRVVPDLAERFTAAPAGDGFVFDLREGLFFHDGTPLGAADVKRSIERLLHPETPSPGASLYLAIKGSQAFHDGKARAIEGLRVLGDRRLGIDLEGPDATFLPKLALAFAAPVCASAATPADPKSAAVPCGAGPFRAESWEPDRGLLLVRHERYHRPGKPYLDGVEWLVNVPSSSQRYKFERGDLDYVRDLTSSEGSLYRASPAWVKNQRWSTAAGTNAVFLNTELPPFDRRSVRRAVALALDPSVLEQIRPDVVAASRVVPPSIPMGGLERGPRSPMRRHDLAAALAEMEKAGFAFDPATGRGGYPEPVDYLAVPDTWDQQTGEIWQQQLARIGLRVRLRLVTYATFLAETTRRRTAAMGKTGWDADFPDPSNFFEPILATSAIADEGSENVAFFSHAELDALLARAHADPDPDRRAAAYERAEEIIRDEAPWIPTYGTRRFELWQPCLHGYAPSKSAERFTDVWLARSSSPPAALGAPLGGRP